MNLFGKILTILVLIMSIVFMSFTMMTYATHRNWRDAHRTATTQLNGVQDQIKQKNIEIGRIEVLLTAERAARAKALAALEQKSNDQKGKLEAEEAKSQSLQTNARLSEQTAQTAQTEMERLKNEVDALREDLKLAQQSTNDKLRLASALQDQLNQTEGELKRTKERREVLRTQLSRAKLVLDRNGLDENSPIDNIPPELDGVVTAVQDTNLIEVSMGSDEGIQAGHKLDIYRQDGSYIGRVVVTDTVSDRSVARIVPEYRQGVIRIGDRVATQLL